MKKTVLAAFTLILLSISCAGVNAEVTGTVYSTDIGAIIDGSPIKSYNINDMTYVKAEDLRGYGFYVVWDQNARILSLSVNSVNAYAPRTILSESDINIKKADVPFREKRYDVYSTDIRTYLYINGSSRELNACNVDGETLVKVRDLSDVAYVNYDNDKRLATIDVIKYELDKAFNEASDKVTITLSDGVTYTGQINDGKPYGIGKTYDNSKLDDFPGTINNMVTTACYINGEISGLYFKEGTYSYTIGSDQGTYTESSYGNTKTSYSVTVSNFHVNDGEYCCISNVNNDMLDSATGAVCRCLTDNDYLYCIKNTEIYDYTTYTDGDMNIEPETELPEFDLEHICTNVNTPEDYSKIT